MQSLHDHETISGGALMGRDRRDVVTNEEMREEITLGREQEGKRPP